VLDVDKSQSISLQELGTYNFAGRTYPMPTLRKVLKVFDQAGTGAINFQQFAYMNQFFQASLDAFASVDTARAGKIPAQACVAALQKQQLCLSTPDVIQKTVVALRQNSGAQGDVALEEYIALATHIAILRSHFEWRDRQRAGQICLDFNACLDLVAALI
jgi:Ca2+-binding EF-hand superfamily protein